MDDGVAEAAVGVIAVRALSGATARLSAEGGPAATDESPDVPTAGCVAMVSDTRIVANA